MVVATTTIVIVLACVGLLVVLTTGLRTADLAIVVMVIVECKREREWHQYGQGWQVRVKQRTRVVAPM